MPGISAGHDGFVLGDPPNLVHLASTLARV
jgi:hypothetical protein